ncbi:HAD-superfamily hydrolase, subfamily IA, variant 3 family protein [Methylocaldum marinum]|uniref:HAD-superfamily hydrolase, subfamily IA, variant 3 family protein n=1 Tax=Methylocaldum marinum TaxID=1432792 RepID=A0A250KNX7_9GAMM|nr:glycosyl hydrolase family 65 protein [Methylocaldum marinum]BBA33246.1 HAD-superfamily hydrolase, subfamily IA, variant 3 family protein [Methylocaldum marinum]
MTEIPVSLAEAGAFHFHPTDDPLWRIEEVGFNLAREHEIESLFAVSNGYVGSRASLAEGSALSNPATFIAGVFDTNTAAQGDPVPELAAAPDWMQLSLLTSGREFRLEEGNFVWHRRMIDMYHGILWREFDYRTEAGGLIHVRACRLASLADRHVLFQSIQLDAENRFPDIHLRALTAPVVERPGRVRLTPEPCPPSEDGDSASLLELCTHTTQIKVAVASAGRLRIGGEAVPPRIDPSPDRRVESWELDIEAGKPYRFDRLVVIYTSREVDRPSAMAAEHLRSLLNAEPNNVIAAHARAWEKRWRESDVEIAGDAALQRAVRFAGYHLIGAVNPADERVSIGARALTGEAYKGHVFWDTEIFMLPFYVLTDPPSARALLMFRYHSLSAAREKARRLGYQGALYAWESTNTGEEMTPGYSLSPDGEIKPILNGVLEHHISADVAYAVWQYWQATADETFLLDAGAEILFETARFWASRGLLDEDGSYHIREVIGPDEYHEGVDDNAFTNVMAQWNLECAAEAARMLIERWPDRWSGLAHRLDLREDEADRWHDLARRMYTGLDTRTGLLEHFKGYFELDDINLSEYGSHALPIDMILGRERTQLSNVVKQADVVMLIYLLWDRFSPEVREINFRYYEPRTAHGSSLSPSIHAAVAARLGDLETGTRYFHQASQIDLANNMGNAAGGVHAAALGGLWQAAVLGFGGLRLGADGLSFTPHCPPAWKALRFRLVWRGTHLHVDIQPEIVEIAAESGMGVAIRMGDAVPAWLGSGQRMCWKLVAGHWKEVSS